MAIKDLLKEKLGAAEEEGILYIDKDKVLDAAKLLYEEGFKYFSFVTAIDRKDHFELYYRVRDLERKESFDFKVRLGIEEEIESVSSVYKGAEWHEREVYDLFGVKFKNHPDLRRILLPEDWDGHPLRKEYPIDAPHPPYR